MDEENGMVTVCSVQHIFYCILLLMFHKLNFIVDFFLLFHLLFDISKMHFDMKIKDFLDCRKSKEQESKQNGIYVSASRQRMNGYLDIPGFFYCMTATKQCV